MYTAWEIRNVEFTKNMGGFKAAEVEVFVDRCAETVESLTAEKEELSKKLGILADKLQEYRRDEDSIRAALVSAQRLGDSVVRDANQKAQTIVDEAKAQADAIVAEAKGSIAAYEKELDRLKTEISEFRARILGLYKEHLAMIKSIPDVSVRKTDLAPQQAPKKETAPAPKPKETESPKAKPESGSSQEAAPSKFSNLKFGEDYDIRKDKD